MASKKQGTSASAGNPIDFVLAAGSVRVNHEYLADDGVIKDFLDIKSYSEKLINFISCSRNIPLQWFVKL